MKKRRSQVLSPGQGPTVAQLEAELERERYRRRYDRALRGTIYTLITVAAAAVLVATLFLPVLRIYGTSMSPTLADGDVVAALRSSTYERGDVIAFYYTSKILVKRVIGLPGEWIDIDADGNVSVDGVPLDEPYLAEPMEPEPPMHFEVPEGCYFMLGDNRNNSRDARYWENTYVEKDKIIAKVLFCYFPRPHLIR